MNKPYGRRNIPSVSLAFGRHLVYAEGTKTEPLYVEDLKLFVSEELNVSKDALEIIPVKASKGKHTVDLVEFAINDVEKRKKKNEIITNVWIFYDKDSFKDFNEAYRLIKKQDDIDSNIDWKACWSNECFEVWIYHYFENLVTPIERKQYISKINSFLKKNGCKDRYSKTMPNLHHFLTSYGGDIRKAVQLMKNKDTSSDEKPNPSSGIYQFAEFLLAYIDRKEKCII